MGGNFINKALGWVAVTLLASLTVSADSFTDLNGLFGYYEGTDRAGHAFHVERLGTVGPFPLWAYWSSDGEGASKHLGEGWRIPFLESRIVPLSDHLYEMMQPNGVSCFVKRNPRKPDQLFCGRAWKGAVHGDEISLSADFGGDVGSVTMTFLRGRLAHLRTKDGQFSFFVVDRAVEKVTGGGKSLLQVQIDKTDSTRVTFVFDGGKSRTVCVRGDSLALPEMCKQREPLPYALERIIASDGSVRKFSYSMEDRSAVFTSPEAVMKWDPYLKTIVARGDWTYKVAKPNPEWNNPVIERKHVDGRKESYFFDLMNGHGRRLNSDGTVLKWQKFPSGNLYGLVRSKELFRDKTSLERIEYSYDSVGHLIFSRYVRGAGVSSGDAGPNVEELWYAPDGRIVRKRIDGKVVAP